MRVPKWRIKWKKKLETECKRGLDNSGLEGSCDVEVRRVASAIFRVFSLGLKGLGIRDQGLGFRV